MILDFWQDVTNQNANILQHYFYPMLLLTGIIQMSNFRLKNILKPIANIQESGVVTLSE